MQKQESRSAAISLAVIAFVILIALGLVVEILRIYAPGVWAAFSSGNGNALETCFEGADTGYSVFLLWVLSLFRSCPLFCPPCRFSWWQVSFLTPGWVPLSV